jgi:hypothetical protein
MCVIYAKIGSPTPVQATRVDQIISKFSVSLL